MIQLEPLDMRDANEAVIRKGIKYDNLNITRPK